MRCKETVLSPTGQDVQCELPRGHEGDRHQFNGTVKNWTTKRDLLGRLRPKLETYRWVVSWVA